MQVQQVNWMCVFIKWFAGSEIPVCTNNRTVGTLHATRRSSGTFSRSQERPFRRPVLKSSVSKVADQPRSSTPTIPTALVASRYLWQLRAEKGGGGQQTDKEREGERRERGAGPLREGARAPQHRVASCMPMRRFPCSGRGRGGAGGATAVLPLYNNIFSLLPPRRNQEEIDLFKKQYWNL